MSSHIFLSFTFGYIWLLNFCIIFSYLSKIGVREYSYFYILMILNLLIIRSQKKYKYYVQVSWQF